MWIVVLGDGVLHRRYDYAPKFVGADLRQTFSQLDQLAREFQSEHNARNTRNQLVLKDPGRWSAARVVRSFDFKVTLRDQCQESLLAQ